MGFLITVWGILTILIFKPKNLAVIDRTAFLPLPWSKEIKRIQNIKQVVNK